MLHGTDTKLIKKWRYKRKFNLFLNEFNAVTTQQSKDRKNPKSWDQISWFPITSASSRA